MRKGIHVYLEWKRINVVLFVSIHLLFGPLLLLDLLFTTTPLHMTTQIKKLRPHLICRPGCTGPKPGLTIKIEYLILTVEYGSYVSEVDWGRSKS
jgi:hypothetical protein